MKGLGQKPRQKSRQDACATEEKAALRDKWQRHSCLCAVDEAWIQSPAHPVASPLLIYGTAIKTPRKPFHYSNLKISNRR
jgi:hypothetical protein